jgi:hypothetical protein
MAVISASSGQFTPIARNSWDSFMDIALPVMLSQSMQIKKQRPSLMGETL